MSLEGPAATYAGTRLIAYIGNKRALLPFLDALFDEIEETEPVRTFLDPFAGSGSVSRLARTRGWLVEAADAEEYAALVCSCWLGVPAEALDGLFIEEGGLEVVLERLNALHPSRENHDFPHEPYLARHYAPADTARADWRRERLFYTAENAVFLDRARNAIEELCPQSAAIEEPCPRAVGSYGQISRSASFYRRSMERALLLGPLVYAAATQANTSGVFKACHKGFGGHGQDALGRILKPIRLEAPTLWPGPAAHVERSDAARFCRGRSVDLCYLDPPYNQHQYGSNYHLLNTIVRWDRKPVSEERRTDGSFRCKAGIDPSWMQRRSAFCSKTDATNAFRELFAGIDAKRIVLSYNDEGIVPPEELYDLLSDRAEVRIRSSEYVRYRGGRQSSARRLKNRELLFIAERRTESCAVARRDLLRDGELGALRSELRLSSCISSALSPERIFALPSSNTLIEALSPGDQREYPVQIPSPRENQEEALSPQGKIPEGGRLYRSDRCIGFVWSGGLLELPTFRHLVFEPGAAVAAASLPAGLRESLAGLLEPLLARDSAEACAEATGLLESGAADGRLQSFALARLRKLAHPKYRSDYAALASRLRMIAQKRPTELGRLGKGLEKLALVAEARMGSNPPLQLDLAGQAPGITVSKAASGLLEGSRSSY
ncbi:MAG: DNA adenine methylase [Spirochaetaceae bacterium]|nr:DNA adenine methylase [Spirochaetaceae bacterium]